MKFIKTDIEGLYLVEGNKFRDSRGLFCKIYQTSEFSINGIDYSISEHYFSTSHKGVIRGMHFQTPPYPQAKLVYVICGKIFDVILDLRKQSKTYKEFRSFELRSGSSTSIFIPVGCAHGFQSLEDNTITVYLQSNEFNAKSDSGINPLSLGIKWPVPDYILSDKDRRAVCIDDYVSPFEK